MRSFFVYLFLFVSTLVYGQHFVAMDIEVERGREKDVKEIFDNYLEKHGTDGMSILIFRNQIRDKTVSSHTVVWLGSIDQINNGLSGKNYKGSDTDLFWKSLWEIAEFEQNYTGDIVSADGDPTSNKGQDYQIVYGVTPNNRSAFIKSWDKMMKKLNIKGARHLIATPTLNRTYNSTIIGVNIGADYKNTLDGLNRLWDSDEWPKFWEESGGWKVDASYSRVVVARY